MGVRPCRPNDGVSFLQGRRVQHLFKLQAARVKARTLSKAANYCTPAHTARISFGLRTPDAVFVREL